MWGSVRFGSQVTRRCFSAAVSRKHASPSYRKEQEAKALQPAESYDISPADIQTKLPAIENPIDEVVERHRSILNKAAQNGFAPLETLNYFQSDWEFSIPAIRRWYRNRQYHFLIEDQRFIEERHAILGFDLAAAHFLLHRFGAVKFVGQSQWIAPGDAAVSSLPEKFDKNYRVEAIDVSGSSILYEGLENLMQLRYLRWLNASNCQYLDDFAMDMITAELAENLEYLDISGCKLLSESGVAGIAKLKKLKQLKMHNLPRLGDNLNLICLMLEEALPGLKILTDVEFDNPSLLDERKMKPQLVLLDPPPPEPTFLCIDELHLNPYRRIMHKIDFHFEIEPRLAAHLMLGNWVPPGYENYVPPPNLKRIVAERVDDRHLHIVGKVDDVMRLESGKERAAESSVVF